MTYLVAVNPTGQVGAAMRLDDQPNIEEVMETLQEWSDVNPERKIGVSTVPDKISN